MRPWSLLLGLAAGQCLTGGSFEAVTEAAELVPGWEANSSRLQIHAVEAGTSHCTFHVTAEGRSPGDAAVRLLLPFDHTAAAARLLASRGLGPEVYGSDANALALRWVPDGTLPARDVATGSTKLFGEWLPPYKTAERLGQLVGRLHSLPAPAGGGAHDVWTHGDLHLNNVLKGKDRQLLIIDLERVGARPAVTDLARLLFDVRIRLHTDGRTAADGESFPSAARQALMQGYLAEVGLPSAAVGNWLWACEIRTPEELARLAGEDGVALPGLAALLEPLAREVVSDEVRARNEGRPTRLVEDGALAMAVARADPELRARVAAFAGRNGTQTTSGRPALLRLRRARLF